MDTISVGMVPVKSLSFISKICSFGNIAISVGIVPVRKFSDTSNIRKFVIIVDVDGTYIGSTRPYRRIN